VDIRLLWFGGQLVVQVDGRPSLFSQPLLTCRNNQFVLEDTCLSAALCDAEASAWPTERACRVCDAALSSLRPCYGASSLIRASRTARSLSASSSRLKGFCKKAAPEASSFWLLNTSAVCPDMRTAARPGRSRVAC
jgi:hypothetical protein